MERNLNSPAYKRWRRAVFKRDKYICQMCKRGSPLEAHHIVRWADNYKLRYDITNGITLCVKCHEKVTGRESSYAEQFRDIVRNIGVKLSVFARIQKLLG